LDALFEGRGEEVAFTEGGEDGIAAGVEGFEFFKAVADGGDLDFVEFAGAFLAIAGNEGHGGTFFEEDGGGGDFGLLQMINGTETLTFRGIRVIPQWRWDEILTAIGIDLPHYIEYTTPLNKVIATDVMNPATELTTWYDEKDEKVYTKSRFKMGVNYIHHSLISVGY
jgi:hypothetical protein